MANLEELKQEERELKEALKGSQFKLVRDLVEQRLAEIEQKIARLSSEKGGIK